MFHSPASFVESKEFAMSEFILTPKQIREHVHERFHQMSPFTVKRKDYLIPFFSPILESNQSPRNRLDLAFHKRASEKPSDKRTRLVKLAVALHEMGFQDERVERLLKHTCVSTVEEALYYLTPNEWQAWEHPFVPQSVGEPREKNCYFCKKKTLRNLKFMPDLLPLNWEITRSVHKERFTIIQYGRGVLINNEALQNV